MPAHCLWRACPQYQMPGDGADLWMKGSHGSLTHYLANSAVLLFPVQGSSGHTKAFAPTY